MTYLAHHMASYEPDLGSNFQVDLLGERLYILTRPEESNTTVPELFHYHL